MKIKPEIYDGTKVFFNLMRREIAIATGILAQDKYFGTPDDGIDWQSISKMTDFFGYWSEQPKDPIWYLLAHSDSDGYLTKEQATLLVDRLKEVSPTLPGKDFYPNWQQVVKNISTRLQKACNEGKDITFE